MDKRQIVDDRLGEIESAYVAGQFDECLRLIDSKYYHLRRYFPPASGQRSSLPVHSCNRDPQCDCGLLTSYLLALAFQRQEKQVSSFLESNGVHEPSLRMPFDQFLEWLQLEIYRGQLEKADEMLRDYIFQSTRLRTEAAAEEGKEYKSMWSSMRKPGFGGFGSSSLASAARDLPLSKQEYYDLLELLVFYILLPSKGFTETKRQMQTLPMPKKVREAFEQRLVDMRNTVVADLKLTEEPQPAPVEAPASHVVTEPPPAAPKKPEGRGQKIIFGLALLGLLYSLIKLGIHRRLILAILDSKLVRWLLLMVFNYRYGAQK